MDAIVAVYSDWGIGAGGTQPIALSADRAYFRKTTKGAAVIAGRRTVEDFPGKKPLPGRENFLLTRQDLEFPGFTVVHSPQEAVEKTAGFPQVFVIGGGSVYRALLPYCRQVYVTKLDIAPESDTFFPNLDESPDWVLAREGEPQQEGNVSYRFCIYQRR